MYGSIYMNNIGGDSGYSVVGKQCIVYMKRACFFLYTSVYTLLLIIIIIGSIQKTNGYM